jgi:hypothetical protein
MAFLIKNLFEKFIGIEVGWGIRLVPLHCVFIVEFPRFLVQRFEDCVDDVLRMCSKGKKKNEKKKKRKQMKVFTFTS